jgi:hypothetical protein
VSASRGRAPKPTAPRDKQEEAAAVVPPQPPAPGGTSSSAREDASRAVQLLPQPAAGTGNPLAFVTVNLPTERPQSALFCFRNQPWGGDYMANSGKESFLPTFLPHVCQETQKSAKNVTKTVVGEFYILVR